MRLTNEELSLYHDQGLLLRPDAVLPGAIAALESRLEALKATDMPGRVLESDGRTVRALHGCHLTDEFFSTFVRLSALLEPARQILGQDVYVYQFKINMKAALGGDAWPWHQDFIYWRNEDGMPAPRAVNVLVNLDDVTEFNGPMYFVPGSHREGCIDLATGSRGAAGDWRENVRADLKYQIQAEMLGGLVKRYGMVAPKGSAGSALFFDSNVVHGSPPNISPFHRRVIIVTYNAVDNVPVSQGPQRPDFLVSRDYRPLSPVATLGPPR